MLASSEDKVLSSAGFLAVDLWRAGAQNQGLASMLQLVLLTLASSFGCALRGPGAVVHVRVRLSPEILLRVL